MGFNTTASTETVRLVAKLTPFGRKALVTNDISLITSFSLGDSDANYRTSVPLLTGQMPAIGGDISSPTGTTNGTPTVTKFRSVVLADNLTTTRKAVEPRSNQITTSINQVGSTTLSGSSLTHDIINKNSTSSNLTNLFVSFGLPVTVTQKNQFTGLTVANGGLKDTSLSGFNQDNVLVIGIPNDQYGEMLDGKAINVNVQSSATTYNIYSTFQSTLTPIKTQDANVRETSQTTARMGNNYALLFSDGVRRPNGNASKSWATGFNTVKPFSVNNKEFFALKSNLAQSITADTAVGLAFLDKGFIVLTYPDIVSTFDVTTGSTATTITFDSINNEVAQNITLIADRGEFGNSTNPTYSQGDDIRISEVGLHDAAGNLIAVAKPDKHIVKPINSFLALGIKITV